MPHDTHCHVEVYPDAGALLAQLERDAIDTTWVMTDPAGYEAACRRARGLRHVRVAAGLHPQIAHRRRSALPLLLEQIERTRWVGEVGLDYVTPDADDRATQRRVFAAVLDRCARLDDRILTIHSRRSAADVLDALDGAHPKAILHWFSGDPAALDRAAAERRWFSINPAMVLSDARRLSVLRMPADRVLLESDGPYVKVKGRPATPGDGTIVVQHLASLWARPREAVRRQLAANYAALTGEAATA